MTVEKMSVSFEAELGEDIREAARLSSESVSAWLAEAARRRLRSNALQDAVAAFEEEFAPIPEEDRARARRVLDRMAPGRTIIVEVKQPEEPKVERSGKGERARKGRDADQRLTAST
jgi:hypothetical protein